MSLYLRDTVTIFNRRKITNQDLRLIRLYEHNHKLNTVSTYMRMLWCVYNKGVDAGQKKALPTGELHALLYKDPKSDKLRK